jgi:branched-chain amino acid aminotransferase
VNTSKASTYSWFNGVVAEREKGAPSVASISFHLGTGVFDGMIAYYNDRGYYVHRMESHLVRFREGAERMGLPIPWSVEQLAQGIRELLELEPVGTQYIRPIAFRGGPELWVTGSIDRPVDVCIFTVRVDRDCDSLMTCHISPVERISSRAIPGHTKVSGAYVNSFNARRRAELAGFDDGIMLDREGRVAEASAANFFAIRGDTLVTPPVNADVFPGVTRQVILELAKGLRIDCVEANLRASDLHELDGAFLCSTLMEIRGIAKLGERPLKTSDSSLYRRLITAFREVTHQ